MRISLSPAEPTPFLPLPESQFPPLTPEYRASLRTQRELEGAISALTTHQGKDQDQVARLGDELRSLDAKIRLAREQKTIAEVQGNSAAGPIKDLANLARKQEHAQAALEQLTLDIDIRTAEIQKREAELAAHRPRVRQYANAYFLECRKARVSEVHVEAAREWFRMWGAFRGQVDADHKFWWIKTFLGLTAYEIRDLLREGEAQMAQFIAEHPLTDE